MKYIKEKAKAQLFMKQLCKNFSDQKRAFILVLHIVPSSIPLIQSLGTI